MFKYKVSIYLKSGNVIHLRCNEILGGNTGLYDRISKVNCFDYEFNEKDISGIIIKKWWQRWE